MSESLAVYAARRVLTAVGVAVGLSALTFLLMHLLTPEEFPDPRPLPVELLGYLRDVFLRADLGTSKLSGRPVTAMLADGVSADLSLLAGATLSGAALGIAGGVFCAHRPQTPLARALAALAALALCAPVYFVGFLVILLFAPSVDAPLPIPLVTVNSYKGLSEDPVAWLHALVVPWLVAGAPLAAMCLRLVRGALRDVAGEDFVRTAVAKGVPPSRVATRHTLPIALPPALTLVGGSMSLLLANVVLVEAVFGIPGVYRFLPDALDNRDLPLLMAVVIVGSLPVVVANAAADIAQAALDPRVRLSAGTLRP